MRIGLLPGQAQALRAAYAEQRRRLTRRGLFVAAGASFVAGACGFAAGGGLTSAPEPVERSAIHALALGPLDELRAQAMHVETAFAADPGDPILGSAIHRLIALALTQPADEVLARRLLRLADAPDLPSHLREGLHLLQTARRR